MAASLPTFLKHLWLDADDTARLVQPDVLQRITDQVAASERLHSGEIRICVEASLPMSYLWRVNTSRNLADATRERAVMMFSKLGVWDTAHNNGVLVYVMLAEHAIEIVADRGIAAHVGDQHWATLVMQMSSDFRQGQAEVGLRRAVDDISAKLTHYFGIHCDSDLAPPVNPNELPDAPVLR